MEKAVADRLSDSLTCECGGGLAVMLGKQKPEDKLTTYFPRCVRCHRYFFSEIGLKKRPLSEHEQVFAEEAIRYKVNNSAKEAEKDMKDTQVTTTKEAPVTKEQQESNQFALRVLSQLKAGDSRIVLSEHQERLAKRLWMACNLALRDLEEKRRQEKPNDLPIIWANIDLEQLAIDAWRRVDLGLDALIPNHIHPVPFHQGRSKKYKLELMIGYAGKDFYRRKVAIEEPLDIVYELVHKNDQFTPIKSAAGDSYELRQPNPFNRGPVIGGFGYIKFDDSRKNNLVLVEEHEFLDAEKAAKTKKFWRDFPTQMKYVVLVRKTTKELKVDPRKINDSYRVVETEDAILAGEPLPEFAVSKFVEGKKVAPESQEKSEPPEPAKVASSAASLAGAGQETPPPPSDTSKPAEAQNSGKSEGQAVLSLKDQFIAASKAKGYTFDTEKGVTAVRTWLTGHGCPMLFEEATDEKQRDLLAKMSQEPLPF